MFAIFSVAELERMDWCGADYTKNSVGEYSTARTLTALNLTERQI
jgi:hypothetical protein